MNDCIFCKIANGPGPKEFDGPNFVVIRDIAPQARLHYLVIPKKHFENIEDLSKSAPEILAEIFAGIADLSEKLGLSGGYRVITNVGADGCQSVRHAHIHLLGGERLSEKMG